MILLQCFLISHPSGCYNHWDLNSNSLRCPVFLITDSYSGALETQCPPPPTPFPPMSAATGPPHCQSPGLRLFSEPETSRTLDSLEVWPAPFLTSPRSLWPPDLWVELWLAPTLPHPLTCSNKLGSVQQLHVCADVGPCLQCWTWWLRGSGGSSLLQQRLKAETDLTSSICSISYLFDVSIRAGLVGQRSLVRLSTGPNHPWRTDFSATVGF